MSRATGASSGRILSWVRGACGQSTSRPRPPSPTPPARDSDVVWHDVECGAYAADLELWEELATEREGAVLELGCGTGRVGLWLARRGHRVFGLDRDPALAEEFNARAKTADFVFSGAYGLEKTKSAAVAGVGEASAFDLGEAFGLVLAPMQLVQLLEGADERAGCLRSAARHLRPGGLLALAIVEGVPADHAGEAAPALPDVREVDGWVYSSLPLETILDGERIVVRRLRQTVSPDGELDEEVDEIELRALTVEELEAEAAAVGLRPAGRREIPATEAHVGSTVVLLEKEGSRWS
jgi:SAM-dependent methyltransferase